MTSFKYLATTIVIVLFAMGPIDTLAQKPIGLYTWKNSIVMKACNIYGVRTGGAELSEPGQEFRVIGDVLVGTNHYSVMKILDYAHVNKRLIHPNKIKTDAKFFKYNYNAPPATYEKLTDQDKFGGNYSNNQIYFIARSDSVDSASVKYINTRVSGSLSFGIVNFPFKYRPQKGKADFSGAFNFGAAVGYKFKHRTYGTSFSIITCYSVSNIVLDSVSTSSNQSKLSKTNNFTAFSFSAGVLLEYQKVQAGVFIGWDTLNRINQEEYGWHYNGKPWFSVGFGFSIFSSQTPSSSTASPTTQVKE